MLDQFKKINKLGILVAAFLGMGMSMPGCPGQQIQTQLETIQSSHQELAKKVKTLEGQLTQLNTDMTQVKQLLPQMTNVIQAQKGAIDQVDAAIKELKNSNNTKGRRR